MTSQIWGKLGRCNDIRVHTHMPLRQHTNDSNTLYMPNMDVGSNQRWISESTIMQWHHSHHVMASFPLHKWPKSSKSGANWASICRKLPRYVLYKCTYVPYNGTFGAFNQGLMLDVWQDEDSQIHHLIRQIRRFNIWSGRFADSPSHPLGRKWIRKDIAG